jgi:hypothetical protein
MTALLPIHVQTDADGAFRIDQLASGTVTLTVEADEDRSGASATARVGDPEYVTLRCANLVSTRVRVLGDDGQPVGGATVSVSGREKQETDEDGVAELPALRPDGEPVVVDGEPQRECVTVTVVPGGEIQEIRLRRAGPVRGSVVGPDGAPVEGADVRVDGSASRLAFWLGGGRFSVFGVPLSTPVTLGIRGPGGTWYDTTLAPGDARHDVVLRVPEPVGTLAVYVADSLHPGAIVTRRAGIEIGRIDDAGPLEHLPIVPDAAPIDVQVGPDLSGRYALVRDIRPRGFLRVRLAKGTTVEGRIATAEGHAVPYAKIHATTEQGYATTAKAFGDGRFRIPGLPTGRVKLSAEWRGRRGSVVAEAPGDDVTLVLE